MTKPASRPELEQDPVWQAMQRAPVGPPLTDEERQLLLGSGEWTDGAEVTAEIARRCKSGA